MNALFRYLAEAALYTTVLYGVYWLFLRKETLFSLNRWYLVFIILFSFLFPLIPFRWQAPAPAAALSMLLNGVVVSPAVNAPAAPSGISWTDILTGMYFGGVILLMARFAGQLLRLYRIIRRFGITVRNGKKMVCVDNGYAPFSFFGLIFLHEPSVPTGSLATVLEHEEVHIRQMHSLDRLLATLLSILQWFNPFAWKIAREMRNIHEFLADEAVLQNGINRQLYQQMILDESMGIRVNELTHHFNVSLIKKRIDMMTKPKSNVWAAAKLVFAFPAVAGLALILTAGMPDSRPESQADDTTPVFISGSSSAIDHPQVQDKPKKENQEKSSKASADKDKVYDAVEKMPAFPGGDEARAKFFVANVKYPPEALKKGIQGTVFVTFIVRADGAVTKAKILRGIGGGCDEEALRVVKMMPNWIPGESNGNKVDVSFSMPVKFLLDEKKK